MELSAEVREIGLEARQVGVLRSGSDTNDHKDKDAESAVDEQVPVEVHQYSSTPPRS